MQFGRYRVVEHLGDDEAGAVLAAVDVYTGQAYDVRVLWETDAADEMRRKAFVRVANAIAAEGDHDHGVHEGHSYIAYPSPDPDPEAAPVTGRRFPWLAVVGVVVVLLVGFLAVSALGGEDEPAQATPTAPVTTPAPTPTTETGLRGVFPSLARETACVVVPSVAGRSEVVECDRPGRVLVRYSEWLEVRAMKRHYAREFKGAPLESWTADRQAIGTVWRPSQRLRKGVWKLAAAYDDEPYSVSVTGPSLAARDAAFRTVEVSHG